MTNLNGRKEMKGGEAKKMKLQAQIIWRNEMEISEHFIFRNIQQFEVQMRGSGTELAIRVKSLKL